MKKQFRILYWLLVVVMLTTTSCGKTVSTITNETSIPNTTESNETSTPNTTESNEASTPYIENVKQGGQVVIPLIADPGTMNPLNAASTAEVIMSRVLFNGLTRWDKDTLEPIPMLAKSWETSEDGSVWIFYLQDNVKWHDGEAFTAEDVKFSMDTFLSPDFLGKKYLGNVESTEVVDELTVKFYMKAPFPSFPTYLSETFMIVPKHLLEGKDIANDVEFNKDMPIGTGAFKMIEYIPGEQIILEANPDFFLGKPNLDRIIFKILPEQNTQIAQLKTGEINLLELESVSLPSVQGDENIKIETDYKSKWWALHLNFNFPLFQDKNVRQAIAYAIDRDLLVESLLLGNGSPAGSPIVPKLAWAYNPNVKPYPYDKVKALELLKESGWEDTDGDGILDKDGQKLSFTLQVIKGNPTAEQASTILQQEFKDIGMDVVMKSYEFASFITEVRDTRTGPNMSQAYIVWMTPQPEPDGNYAYFHSSNCEKGSNFNCYKSERVDELLELGRSSTDLETRKAAYYEFQEIVQEDVARVFLFYPKVILATSSNLHGVPPSCPYQYTEQWYYDMNN